MRKLILVLSAAVLAAAVALPALADSTAPTAAAPATGHVHWFAGSVGAVGSSTLTVGVLWTGPHDSSLNGQSVTVNVGSGTDITSGPKRTPIQLSDIQPNDLVGVRVTGTDPSSLTATKIHVYCNCHWVGGTVSSIGSSSFVVQVAKTGPYDTVLNGQAVTMNVTGATTFLKGKDKTSIQFSDLKAGDGVGVIFGASGFFKAPGFDPSTATFTAKQVHVWGHRAVPAAASDPGAAAVAA
jgi:hypothetical protein